MYLCIYAHLGWLRLRLRWLPPRAQARPLAHHSSMLYAHSACMHDCAYEDAQPLAQHSSMLLARLARASPRDDLEMEAGAVAYEQGRLCEGDPTQADPGQLATSIREGLREGALHVHVHIAPYEMHAFAHHSGRASARALCSASHEAFASPACMHVCMHACMHVWPCIHIHTGTGSLRHAEGSWRSLCIRSLHACMHVHAWVHACIPRRMSVFSL